MQFYFHYHLFPPASIFLETICCLLVIFIMLKYTSDMCNMSHNFFLNWKIYANWPRLQFSKSKLLHKSTKICTCTWIVSILVATDLQRIKINLKAKKVKLGLFIKHILSFFQCIEISIRLHLLIKRCHRYNCQELIISQMSTLTLLC